MLPSALTAAAFNTYPLQARKLALAYLAVFQQLPIAFLPGLLRELIEYGDKFPAERSFLDAELAYLTELTSAQLTATFQPFAQLSISPQLIASDWVNHPAQFVEQESAHLWSTHQLDAFRIAATHYGDNLRAATPVRPLPIPRLGIAVIGQGATTATEPLFRNLRPHGTYFTSIKPEDGLAHLLAAVEARAAAHPTPYAHWHVDGGESIQPTPSLTTVSYQALGPLRTKLLQYMNVQVAKPGMGPEELRTNLAKLTPATLGLRNTTDALADPLLARFQLRLFTEGSGTQIFATTFAQWTTREALRRAEPLTLLVRYAPRQSQRPMNELLATADAHPELDPAGSLVDADMAAWYHWLNQQRLSGADRSVFIAWFESQQQALVIAPSLPRGVQSDSAMDLKALLKLALGG
jgi:hypothetical protein